MNKLVTVSREYGSGGRIIGHILSDKLGVPFYDEELIEMAVQKSGLSREIVETAELRAKSTFSYSLAAAMNFNYLGYAEGGSVNEKLFVTEYEIIKQIGEMGSGVIIGRCADYVLKDMEKATRIFIYGDRESRKNRLINQYGEPTDGVDKKIDLYDRARANYYNYHTGGKWGSYKNYDLLINSSNMTEEDVAEVILNFMAKDNR